MGESERVLSANK